MDLVPEDDDAVIHPRARTGHDLPRRLSERMAANLHEGSAAGQTTLLDGPAAPQHDTAPATTASTVSHPSPDKPVRRTSAQILQSLQAAAAVAPVHAEPQQPPSTGPGVPSQPSEDVVIADVMRKFKRASVEDAEAVRSRRGQLCLCINDNIHQHNNNRHDHGVCWRCFGPQAAARPGLLQGHCEAHSCSAARAGR